VVKVNEHDSPASTCQWTLDVAFTTAQRAIDRLASAGIVAMTDDAKRNRLYCARSVLEVLEGPLSGAQDRGGVS